MSIKIREMTAKEFDSFYKWSLESYTAELMAQENISYDEARKAAADELSKMLPDGLSTPQNHLMTIVESDSGDNIGFIWTLYEVTDGRKQSFICDFTIWEAYRCRGFGTEALRLAEKRATDAGCQECVLFVSNDNFLARVLYQKSGYQILRQAGYGQYMIKQLSPI